MKILSARGCSSLTTDFNYSIIYSWISSDDTVANKISALTTDSLSLGTITGRHRHGYRPLYAKLNTTWRLHARYKSFYTYLFTYKTVCQKARNLYRLYQCWGCLNWLGSAVFIRFGNIQYQYFQCIAKFVRNLRVEWYMYT